MVADVSGGPRGKTQPGPPSRAALLVLGMHRSGTSALARMLSLLGATLPKHVMGKEYRGRGGNEAGHWEPERLVEVHDEMLAEAGSRWDDWRRFDPAGLGPDRLSHYGGEISRLIADEYGDSRLFVLKDPRLCRFVPFYEELLGEMGIAPLFVLTYRNPLSVLDSLASRDGMAGPYASLIWLRHVLDAERATRGKPRVFLAYEEYLDDWRAGAARISSTLGLEWPRGVEDAAQEIDAQLSRDLQHHAATRADLNADQRVGQEVRDVYGALQALTADDGDGEALETLSRVGAELESGRQDFVDATFEEMTVRLHRDQRDRAHLQRLVAKHSGAAEKAAENVSKLENQLLRAQHELRTTRSMDGENQSVLTRLSEEKSVLERQLAALRGTAAFQAEEIERLGPEREKLQVRLNALELGNAELKRRIGAFKDQLARLQKHNKTLKTALSALQESTSWRVTRPLRTARRLAADPRAEISRLRSRGPGAPLQAARPNGRPQGPPARRLAADGTQLMGRLPPEDAARVREAFDADFYLARYPDVRQTGADPFEHYMVHGWREGRDPSPSFATGYYLKNAPDVEKAGMNPFVHWVLHGASEGRPVRPAAPPENRAEAPKARPPASPGGTQLMGRLPPEDAARVREAFDADFYLARYPDVRQTGADPFEHYMVHGWREGRDPSPSFATGYYLKNAPDVEKAGMNPFVHWVLHGAREKRSTLPFHRRLELLDYAPKVSAIVPNYNHARFLGQRIDSILAQTYENVEILILDDCSTDDSRAVIERYCHEYPDRIRAIFNEENSGNVFRQWRKGIDNVTGELVWICESDDFCEPDFLESLVGNFKDRSVNIAFGRIQFSDKEGNPQTGLDHYRESAEPGIWDAPLTRPARQWFAGGFGVNNVIANVGGCIFRRRGLPESVWEETENYYTLGDWFLYCHLAGGGQIAYEPSAVAYFRQHGGNTSVASFVTPGYYKEHERLMLLLRRQWGVPDETVLAFHNKVARQYAAHMLKGQLGPLSNHCDREKLLAEKRTRPHVLIAFLGFHLGGGEIFPIHLANALQAQGQLVSMLALDLGEVKQGMAAMLDPAIPVYDVAWVQEYGADRFLAEAGISVVHSHMISLEWFFFEKCRIETRVPYVVTLHGSYEESGLAGERLLSIVQGVTHFAYTADKNLQPFRELPVPEDIFTKFANAVPDDPLPFQKTRAELGIAEDAVVFTLAARGIKRKGWRAAIAAFRGLQEDNPQREMHLLLAGEGEQADRQFELHGDAPNVTFLGYQSRVHGLFRLSDVAILPTRFAGESCPFCIIEALKTGTPVIATRVGEIENMLDGPEGPAGILIEYQRDTELFIRGLREAMAAMLVAPERERFTRAARTKGETYSMERVALEYAALYEKAIEEAG